jgi:hypothetical protein
MGAVVVEIGSYSVLAVQIQPGLEAFALAVVREQRRVEDAERGRRVRVPIITTRPSISVSTSSLRCI